MGPMALALLRCRNDGDSGFSEQSPVYQGRFKDYNVDTQDAIIEGTHWQLLVILRATRPTTGSLVSMHGPCSTHHFVAPGRHWLRAGLARMRALIPSCTALNYMGS